MNTKKRKRRIPGNRRRTDCDRLSDLYHSGTSGGLYRAFVYQSLRSLERNDRDPEELFILPQT